MIPLTPENLETDFIPPSELEKALSRSIKRRYSQWGWRLALGFTLCIMLSLGINAAFTLWRNSLSEEVITIHNIRDLSSVELCPGDSVRYQYNVASDMISPTVGVVIFSLSDNCPK